MIVRVPIPAEQAPLQPSETKIAMDWPHDSNTPQLRWMPHAEASYVLQTSDDLVEWHNSGEAIQAGASGTEIIQTLPENPADRQFYRLVEIE